MLFYCLNCLLAGDSLDLHIVLVDPLQKTKKVYKNKKKTGDLKYIYQNELDKACLQHDMAYGYFKHWNGRTAANKVLCEDLILLKIQNMMKINVDLPQ